MPSENRARSANWGWACARVTLTFAAYAATAVWLTWPLAARATTDLPNPGLLPFDILSAVWLLAWHAHALATAPLNLPNPNAFHPTPLVLFYAPPALGPLPLFAPVYLTTGSASLAYDVAFLAGMALAGLGVAEVVRRWTDSREAGFLAGLGLVVSPMLRNSTGTAPLCVMLLGLSWVIYAGARQRLDGPTSVALIAGLVLQALVDPTIAWLGALLPLAVIAGVRIARPTTRHDGWRLVSRIAIACALVSPLFIGYAIAWGTLDPTDPGPWSGTVGMDAGDAKTPTVGTLLSTVGVPSAGSFAIIALVATGAILARRRGTIAGGAWRTAALWAAIALVCCRPRLIFGFFGEQQTVFDGPLRSLGRLSHTMLVAIPLLAGLALSEIFRLVGALPVHGVAARRVVTATAVAAVLWASAPSRPYRTMPAPTMPAALRTAIANTGGSVLELPAAGPMPGAVAMYRSIGGWWPLLNGYASFSPPGFAANMAALENPPDRELLERLAAETGLRTIVVRNASPFTAWARWLRSDGPARAGLRRVTEADGDVLFTFDPAAGVASTRPQ